jgi:hypothetical protein
MSFGIKRTHEDDAAGPALDLAAAIAEFYEDFPQHKKDVFILNHQQFATGSEAVASIADALAAVKKENPSASMGMSVSMARGMFEGKLPCSISISDSPFSNKPDMKLYARIVIPAGEEFTARVMKSIFVSDDPIPNTAFPVMPEAYNDTEMWQRYVLDHELGHAVTMMNMDIASGKEISITNHRECEADAYAMIRHYQRYGEDSTFPEYISDVRNMNAIQKGDIGHWTSRAVDEVIALNKKGALKNLTPAEARDLAVDIAARQGLSADAEHNMQKAFAATAKITALAKAGKTPEGDKVMSYMAAVGHAGATTESAAVHDCCRRYMNSIGRFLPKDDLPMTRAADDLRAMANDVKAMRNRTVKGEPEMTGLKRIFRDASINARLRNQEPKPGNDNAAPGPEPEKDLKKDLKKGKGGKSFDL